MNCALCRHGDTRPGEVTVTLQREGTTVILKGVPAEVCDNCGGSYLSEKVGEKVLARAEKAVRSGVEVEILRFAAQRVRPAIPTHPRNPFPGLAGA